MFPKEGKAPAKSVLLVCLILAIIGSFAVSTGEAFCFEYSNRDSIGSNGYLSSIEHSIDWLAEASTSIGKTKGSSSSPLRNGFLRIFALAGVAAVAACLAKANIKIIKKDNIPILKNLVPLNLRI